MNEFHLNEEEAKLAREFEREHWHPKVNKGAIGGHISYTFTPTSLGNSIVMKCNICGQTKNITDYGSW